MSKIFESKYAVQVGQFIKKKVKKQIQKKYISRKRFDYCALNPAQNFLLIFGAKPGKSVRADSTMV